MKWKQTGKGEHVRKGDLPAPSSLRFLSMSETKIEFIRAGDFDGFVYVASPTYDDSLIDLRRYPAVLTDETRPVAADYADSAE